MVPVPDPSHLPSPPVETSKSENIGATLTGVSEIGAASAEAIISVEGDKGGCSNSGPYKAECKGGPVRKKASILRCHHEGCPYTINRAQFMAAHLRYHEFERLGSKRVFICPEEGCGYLAVEHANIGAHRRVHAEAKPFICEIEGCKHVSAQSNNMRSHQMRVHGWAKMAKDNRMAVQKNPSSP
jgi:hypothetical protein